MAAEHPYPLVTHPLVAQVIKETAEEWAAGQDRTYTLAWGATDYAICFRNALRRGKQPPSKPTKSQKLRGLTEDDISGLQQLLFEALDQGLCVLTVQSLQARDFLDSLENTNRS